MAEFAHCAKHHNQYRITEGCSECKKTEAGEEKNEDEQDGSDTSVPPASQVVTEKHVLFLQSRGYNVKSVNGAKKKIANMEEKEREGFFKEASEWIDHNDD